MHNRHRKTGFTLVELLVVVVVIGILASIALANYINAAVKSHVVAVRENMHTCQLAAESYATDLAGVYPTSATSLSPYYPGGNNSVGGAAGAFSTNPFTNVVNESPVDNGVGNVFGARAGGVSSKGAGQVGYAGVAVSGQNTSYAITGYDNTGLALPGIEAGTITVLSNQ